MYTSVPYFKNHPGADALLHELEQTAHPSRVNHSWTIITIPFLWHTILCFVHRAVNNMSQQTWHREKKNTFYMTDK